MPQSAVAVRSPSGGFAVTGAVLSIVLMVLFFGVTKLLPMATALVILAAGLNYWSPSTAR